MINGEKTEAGSENSLSFFCVVDFSQIKNFFLFVAKSYEIAKFNGDLYASEYISHCINKLFSSLVTK